MYIGEEYYAVDGIIPAGKYLLCEDLVTDARVFNAGETVEAWEDHDTIYIRNSRGEVGRIHCSDFNTSDDYEFLRGMEPEDEFEDDMEECLTDEQDEQIGCLVCAMAAAMISGILLAIHCIRKRSK